MCVCVTPALPCSLNNPSSLIVQLLEACVSNCGKSFQEELTKTPFQSEFRSIITGVSFGFVGFVFIFMYDDGSHIHPHKVQNCFVDVYLGCVGIIHEPNRLAERLATSTKLIQSNKLKLV